MKINEDKTLVWLSGEVKTPPFGEKARREAGFFLRMAQKGLKLSNPPFDPMPEIEKSCYDLHIRDSEKTWRIILYVDNDFVVILEVFAKKTKKTPEKIKKLCKKRLKRYQEII